MCGFCEETRARRFVRYKLWMVEQKPQHIPDIWEPLPRLSRLFATVPSGPIFHYTSQGGFLGILREKALWASKIQFLNDSAEFQYTLDLMESRLKEQENNPELKDFTHFRENVIGWLNGSMKYPNIFVASFSERGDLLSQWRAYCPGGTGFSIGFTYDQLLPAIKKEGPNARLVKCVYQIDEQVKIVDELISRAVSRVDKDHLEDSSQIISALLMRDVSNLASIFKHPAFEEEMEWRIVVGPFVSAMTDVSFRPGKSMLVPYYSFSVCAREERLLIQKVNVAPNPHGVLSGWSAIDAIFRYNAHSSEGVHQSSIPYRSW
jgi:Protein of unknown function (DUF2971)